MRTSRLPAIGLLVGLTAAFAISPALAGENYNTLRCIPTTIGNQNTSREIDFPNPEPMWENMLYNWASQLYNPSSLLWGFRCPIEEKANTRVTQGSMTGWSSGCNNNPHQGIATTQVYGQACVVPKAGGTGAQCSTLALPKLIDGRTDCSPGLKTIPFTFPTHNLGDALELRVYIDGAINGSTGAFWTYQGF